MVVVNNNDQIGMVVGDVIAYKNKTVDINRWLHSDLTMKESRGGGDIKRIYAVKFINDVITCVAEQKLIANDGYSECKLLAVRKMNKAEICDIIGFEIEMIVDNE